MNSSLHVFQAVIEELKIFFPFLNKSGQFFKLGATNSRLHICWL